MKQTTTPKKAKISTNIAENTKNEYILRSPYHSNKNYAKKDFKTTNEISYKQPIEQTVIDNKYKKSQKDTTDALTHLSHLPPKYEVSGLPKPTHSTDACKVYQVLSPKSKIKSYDEPLDIPKLPTPRPKPWIGSNPFSSKNQLGFPHKSYDLDNDGVVSTKEYAISKFFDKDGDGKLNKTERENAINAIKNGIEKQYLFSSKGVHKLTPDELKSLNGGWMKHDGIINREQTRSKLLQNRRKKAANDASDIAKQYFATQEKTKIPTEFPYEFAFNKKSKISKLPLKNIENEENIENHENDNAPSQRLNPNHARAQTADISRSPLQSKTNNKNTKNSYPHKTRSQLFESRRNELMDGLEKSRAEAEEYFKPVAFRKLDYQQDFLRRRSTHKSTKTLKNVQDERHKENHDVGRYWESRTNFEIFNAKKLEKEFWQNAFVYKENENRPIEKTSHEIYNMMKNTYKSVDRLPAPFECPKDELRNRDKKFLVTQQNEYEEIRVKQESKPKYEARNHENFKEFSAKMGDIPDNLCVLYGGRKMGAEEEGVASWFKQRKSSLSDTSPMYSSFSRDGVFREPSYATTIKSKSKTNLYQTSSRLNDNSVNIYRPRTAPMHNQTYSTFPSSVNYNTNTTRNDYNVAQNSMLCRYQSARNLKPNRKIKLKFPVRTSGFN